MTEVIASRRGLSFPVPHALGEETVDVLFDGHRVWSTKLPDHPSPARAQRRRRSLAWPEALSPYLRGRTELTVRLSSDESVLAEAEVDFGGDGRVEVTDAQGRWLAMTKWDRLGTVLDGQSTDVRDRLVADGRKLADLMESWGYPIYIVGGSLLGAIRSGGMLPHDDDIDFAFLADAHTELEVGRLSYDLERKLSAAGYTAVVLSLAQIQITFFNDAGNIEYYIDIFTGYHTEDGLYNQPFALRGDLPREALLPTKAMNVDGVDLPAPADPEAWLEFAYGPDWRIPDPSFQFITPPSTGRRFNSSFGVFNRQRVFWEKQYGKYDRRPAGPAGGEEKVDEFLELIPKDAFVIDLGCGDGRLTERIAAGGHQVLGVDYSYEALRLANQTRPDGVEYRFCNVNNRHMLLEFALELISEGKQPYFFAHRLIHELPELGRSDLLVFLQHVLDEQTFCFATVCANEVPRDSQNPETWALGVPMLRRNARRFDLALHVLGWSRQPTSIGDRDSFTTLIWR